MSSIALFSDLYNFYLYAGSVYSVDEVLRHIW
jgi:hypothetical protein